MSKKLDLIGTWKALVGLSIIFFAVVFTGGFLIIMNVMAYYVSPWGLIFTIPLTIIILDFFDMRGLSWS